jgi:hypothetical protein
LWKNDSFFVFVAVSQHALPLPLATVGTKEFTNGRDDRAREDSHGEKKSFCFVPKMSR